MLIKNALVTGCDFGLGLEFVKVLCQDENIKNVFAGYINLEKAPGLKKLVQENSKVTPVELNMVDDETIKKTKANVEAKVGNEGLDLLINNAGINIDDGYLEGTFGDTHLQGGPRRDLLMAHFNVNTVGPISKMTSKNMKQHLRHVLLWLYDENNQITSDEALGKIQQVCFSEFIEALGLYGGDSISRKTVFNWLKKFRNGVKNVDDLEDEPKSGRKVTFDEEALKQLVEDDPKLTIRELAAKLSSSFGTIQRHLHKLGFVSKLGRWVPHLLSEKNKEDRLQISHDLLSRYENGELPLESILTGDEKWCLYVNVGRRHSWVQKGTPPPPMAKPGLHPKKCLLVLFWDSEGVVYWEILPDGMTINAEVYCEILDRLHQNLQEKRPHRRKTFFLHDNATPHTAKVTKAKLKNLGWIVLPHPPYSPDLAPTDYKAFLSLQNWLTRKEFETEEELKELIQEWINKKSPGFWVRGFTDLPRRWKLVQEFEGEYFPNE